ncbi:MAG: HD domain-containing phosphohydrolase [Thermoanaerobaculales bacterium]|jgi:HD-GYP domain-containing protein (c-di-GMP phosphodiesterase class II)|nr:HD domain-containing phosphohydrolase [Thermoanaerobaculales bacterium]
MDVLREFLEFIEGSKPEPVEKLLHRVLLKCRRLTGAEAGTIFIVRGRGAHRRLEAADSQNDVIAVRPASFRVPITTSSIAGFTAATGETVFVEDLYNLPDDVPYTFDHSFDAKHGYHSRSMLAFPLLNHDRRVVGVVQLINHVATQGDPPTAFGTRQAELIVPVNHILGGAIERADMLQRIKAQNRRLRERNRTLAEQRRRITALKDETEHAFQLSINLLARAAEVHDTTTASHVIRVNEYSAFIARTLGLPDTFCDEIRYSAQLHDVGKMSIDGKVLRKQGPLDDEERREMNRHPAFGYRILEASDRLQMAAAIALNHHERWDGTGYPNGRRGEEIPIEARIVALADIYDALRSSRPYKKGFDHDRAREIILHGDDRLDPAGHLDPQLLQLFAEHHSGMAEVWDRIGE